MRMLNKQEKLKKMKVYAINFQDYPSLEKNIRDGYIKTFRTKKQAIEFGKIFDWKDAIKVNRRFESVWIVGMLCFDDDNKIRIPSLEYMTDECGIKRQSVTVYLKA